MISAHQRRIRDAAQASDPRRGPAPSLTDYAVELVSRQDIVPIIAKYEWLGTVSGSLFAGLRAPDGALHGAACFGGGHGGQITRIIGKPALCLQRGACVHYAPHNAASFLINRACKLIYQQTGTAIFYAYGDPEAGEYGGVYQAAGWLYLGQGLDGEKRGRKRTKRYFMLPPGADPDQPGNWRTTRALYRGGGSFQEAREEGWIIRYRAAKHVYATNVGPQRRHWRRETPNHPYPAPRPELKRSVLPLPLLETHEERARVLDLGLHLP